MKTNKYAFKDRLGDVETSIFIKSKASKESELMFVVIDEIQSTALNNVSGTLFEL